MSQDSAYPAGDLSILRPQDSVPINTLIIERAQQAILDAPCQNLTPDTETKARNAILGVLQLSPNPSVTAAWIIENLTPRSDETEELLSKLYNTICSACRFVKTSGAGRPPKGSGVATPVPFTLAEGGTEEPTAVSTPPISASRRSSNFSKLVKSIELCRVTGDTTSQIESCHIIPFSMHNPRFESYIDLVKAMFGEAALSVLLRNVLGRDNNRGQLNINRLDNGIPMTSSCHTAWDSMAFVLKVDWSTYSSDTGEFDAIFKWITDPQKAILNLWDPASFTFMATGTTIPFRNVVPPPLPNGQQRDTPPLPSAHLMYVREIFVEIAHLVGAAGVYEYDDEEESGNGDPVDLVQSDRLKSLSGDDGDSPKTPPQDYMDRWFKFTEFPLTLSPSTNALDLAAKVDTGLPTWQYGLSMRRESMGRERRPGTYT